MTAISELVWPDSGLDGLALLFAQTFHSQPYALSGPQVDGFRLDAHADLGGVPVEMRSPGCSS